MQTVNLGVSGMTCGGCVRSVTGVLSGLDGVLKAEVSLEKQRAQVDFDPGKINVEQLKRAIEEGSHILKHARASSTSCRGGRATDPARTLGPNEARRESPTWWRRTAIA
jgi:copper chaperone